ARSGRAVRAAELRDAALGVDAVTRGIGPGAGRARAGCTAGAAGAGVVLGLGAGAVGAGGGTDERARRARRERQLDVERGGRSGIVDRRAVAGQEVEALSGDRHLTVDAAGRARL